MISHFNPFKVQTLQRPFFAGEAPVTENEKTDKGFLGASVAPQLVQEATMAYLTSMLSVLPNPEKLKDKLITLLQGKEAFLPYLSFVLKIKELVPLDSLKPFRALCQAVEKYSVEELKALHNCIAQLQAQGYLRYQAAQATLFALLVDQQAISFQEIPQLMKLSQDWQIPENQKDGLKNLFSNLMEICTRNKNYRIPPSGEKQTVSLFAMLKSLKQVESQLTPILGGEKSLDLVAKIALSTKETWASWEKTEELLKMMLLTFLKPNLTSSEKSLYHWTFLSTKDVEQVLQRIESVNRLAEQAEFDPKFSTLLTLLTKQSDNLEVVQQASLFYKTLNDAYARGVVPLSNSLSETQIAQLWKEAKSTKFLPANEATMTAFIRYMWGTPHPIMTPLLNDIISYKTADLPLVLKSLPLFELFSEKFSLEELKPLAHVIVDNVEKFAGNNTASNLYFRDCLVEKLKPVGNVKLFEELKDAEKLKTDPMSDAERKQWLSLLLSISDSFVNLDTQKTVATLFLNNKSALEAEQAFLYMKHSFTAVRSFLELPAPVPPKQLLTAVVGLYATMPDPNRFLNHVLQNRALIPPGLLKLFFSTIDQVQTRPTLDLAKKLFPELATIASLYHRQTSWNSRQEHKDVYDQVSLALTRLKAFLEKGVTTVTWQALENAMTGAELSLGFKQWQYDAMTSWAHFPQWKKEPLLTLYPGKVFERVPPRETDAKYHGGYVYYDPKTKLSIELRRAYIVISQPPLGTVIIRNSSSVFGRDLLPEMMYYSASKIYTDKSHLFKPELGLALQSFYDVLSPEFNKDAAAPREHQNVATLLKRFKETMQLYDEWKSSFDGGFPTEGAQLMLKYAWKSAEQQGNFTPFQVKGEKKKNIHLAWVPPTGLPYVVKRYDVREVKHQKELAFYLNALEGNIKNVRAEDYQAKMPELSEFIHYGQENSLKLMLLD